MQFQNMFFGGTSREWPASHPEGEAILTTRVEADIRTYILYYMLIGIENVWRKYGARPVEQGYVVQGGKRVLSFQLEAWLNDTPI